ncbi:hypothetical protein COCNU_contig68843664G000010 [Cocos nucifera]|nr:hypothetical protein [Cocos nucifera]
MEERRGRRALAMMGQRKEWWDRGREKREGSNGGGMEKREGSNGGGMEERESSDSVGGGRMEEREGSSGVKMEEGRRGRAPMVAG